MSNNLILEIKPERNIIANVMFLFKIDSTQWTGFYITIFSILFLPFLLYVLISNWDTVIGILSARGNERRIHRYYFCFFALCTLSPILSVIFPFSMVKKYLKKVRGAQFKIYENKIEIVGGVPYLKNKKLYFSDIAEMIITQNFVQKMFNLISIEFISINESKKIYNSHHANMVFYNIKNTREIKEILIEKFNSK